MKKILLTSILILMIAYPVKANQRILIGSTKTENIILEYEIISLADTNANHSFGIVANIDSEGIDNQLYIANRRYAQQNAFCGLFFNSAIGLAETADKDITFLLGVNAGYKNFLIRDMIYSLEYGLYYPVGESTKEKIFVSLGYSW